MCLSLSYQFAETYSSFRNLIGNSFVSKYSCLLDKSSTLPHEAKVSMLCHIKLYF